MNFKTVIFTALSFLLSHAQCEESCPEQVRVTFPDFAVPPFINGNGISFSNPPGLLVDWVKQALLQAGCAPTVHINRRPKMRAYAEAGNGQTDILLPVTPRYGNSSHLVFPPVNGLNDRSMVLRGLHFSLWVRKHDRAIQWDGKDLVGPAGLRVGAAVGSVAQLMIVDRGWVPEFAKDSLHSIDKLIAGRVAVILVADVVVQGLAADRRLLIERLEPGLETVNFYSGASRVFHARHPAFMKRYWQALHELSRSDGAQNGSPDIPERDQKQKSPRT